MHSPIQQPPIIIHVHYTAPRWLDSSKAAGYLSCKRHIIEELWRSGELPYVTVGHKQVCEKADLDAWADKQPKQTGKLREPPLNSRVDPDLPL